ncbi:baseplate J/gp47 family protein [Robbsia andropogonis]|uniref:baseplate J/gp47 family protein n=1 Tax=Robbsia andropogonis TaxID=28092 RepID=UPI003D1CFD5E
MALTTIAPTIDATGISVPSYDDVLTWLQDQYRGIYGDDVYLEADSQDGQLLAVFASAMTDINSTAVVIYNSFSPATATDSALARNVKINGITKQGDSASTVDVELVGQAGTTITGGGLTDPNQVQWTLPASVTIPPSGSIIATATCTTSGAVALAAGVAMTISTPTRGWQTATTSAAAAEGAPVESDAALRVRQQTSVALPSKTVLEGMVGAVANVTGVTRYASYENDTDATDSNGLPAHTVAIVVEGGDALAIAQAIASKKGLGGGTYGTTSETVTDVYGTSNVIRFFRPSDAPIAAAVTIKALAGYSSATGVALQQAVSDYVNAVSIGGGAAQAVEWDSSITAAKGVTNGGTFKIVSLTLSGPSGVGAPDVTLAFNQAATCTPASVVLTVN